MIYVAVALALVVLAAAFVYSNAASGAATVNSADEPHLPAPVVLVEGFIGNALKLRTRLPSDCDIALPLGPLRAGAAVGSRGTIHISNGRLRPPVDGMVEVEGEDLVVYFEDIRVRFSATSVGTPFERVAPIAVPTHAAVAPLVPGEPNPFVTLYDAWVDTVRPTMSDDEYEHFLYDPRDTDLEPPFIKREGDIAPIAEGDDEASLFLAAADECVIGSMDPGSHMGEDALEEGGQTKYIGLGNDGTGDGLLGVIDPAGNLVLYWVGHDPFGVFYRGASLRGFFEAAMKAGEGFEHFASAMHSHGGGEMCAVPPCYLDGPPELVAQLDALEPGRELLDFRGQPPGTAFEVPHAWPENIIDGLIVVLRP